MKFKEHAAEKAIYKLLGLGMVVFFLQGAILIAGAFATIILSNQSDESYGFQVAAIIYLVCGVILATIGDYLRQIRSGMIVKED